MSTPRRVARNALWYGIELAAGILGTLLISVLVANHFGPTRLAYYIWVSWLTNVTGSMGTLGVPMTVQKFAAEYLGKGDRETVAAIYRTCLRLQFTVAAILVSAGSALVWWFTPEPERWAALLLVGAILPRILGFIPAQINMAAEDMGANLPPALIGSVIQVIMTLTGLAMGWSLTSVAAALFTGTTAELILKLRTVRRRLQGVAVGSIDRELRQRMLVFSGQGIGLMALNFLVWDRSDVFFLRYMQSDARQIAFFSQPFTLADRLQMVPQMAGAPLGVALLAQAGRDRAKLAPMTARASFYMVFLGLPVLLGAAAVAPAFWGLLYKPDWAPAVPVLMTMLVFSIPRAGLQPLQSLLRATEQQSVLLRWGCAAGVVNVVLDLLLVPGHGAMGAAIGNGSAQALAAVGTLISAQRLFGLALPWGKLGRLLGCTLAMAAMAAAIVRLGPYAFTLPLGVASGAIAFLLLVRRFRVLDETDRAGLLNATQALPGVARVYAGRLITFTAPVI